MIIALGSGGRRLTKLRSFLAKYRFQSQPGLPTTCLLIKVREIDNAWAKHLLLSLDNLGSIPRTSLKAEEKLTSCNCLLTSTEMSCPLHPAYT